MFILKLIDSKRDLMFVVDLYQVLKRFVFIYTM